MTVLARYTPGDRLLDLGNQAGTGPRIIVERHYDRLLVTIRRRQSRVFSLSLDEAEDLVAELQAQLAEVRLLAELAELRERRSRAESKQLLMGSQ